MAGLAVFRVAPKRHKPNLSNKIDAWMVLDPVVGETGVMPVAKVSELKERARALEQQGELAKAQAIYQHIIKHLQGTPALKSELPLYVKIGDLALKRGEAKVALAAYERAAEHYARAGSARSIAALAEKIRRADPTRDDEAVALGRALLVEGHPAAGAEVVARYAARIGRADVAALLGKVAAEADDGRARKLVETGIGMLAHTPPDPTESAVPAARTPPPAGPVPAPPERRTRPSPAGSSVSPSMSDTLEPTPPAPPADTPPTPAPPSDLPLVIEHGVPQPEAAPPLAREAEPEPTPEPAPPPEPAPEPVREPVRAPEPEPDRALEPQPAPEPEPRPRPRRPKGAVPPRPRRGESELQVLVREQKPEPPRRFRWVLPAAATTAVVLGAAGAVWFLGFRSSEEDDGGTRGATPIPIVAPPIVVDSTTPVVGDSLASGRDSLAAADSAASFGPIGFNTVVDSPAVVTPRETTRATTPADPVPSPAVPAPPVAAAVLPTVVVPAGHAITSEIVVIPGLQVLSVAETRNAGVLGYRVIQQDDGVEVQLVATPANFGGDTAGRGQAVVELQGDTAIGSIRVGRYLVQARATMPSELLRGLLRQAIRARPVN
jgi:hypothetical protein